MLSRSGKPHLHSRGCESGRSRSPPSVGTPCRLVVTVPPSPESPRQVPEEGIMSDPGELDVVIVNWNTGGFLADCLRSVHESASVELGRVIVVDNASGDDSLTRAAPWLDQPT